MRYASFQTIIFEVFATILSGRRPSFGTRASVRRDTFHHHYQIRPVGLNFRFILPFRHVGKVDIALFKLEIVDDQTAALHMEDLHGRTGLVDKDEGVAVLDVAPHLVGHDAAERVEALAHIRGVRVQEEAVAVIQAEHPLPGQHDEPADGFQRDASAQTHGHSIRKADLTGGLLMPGLV